MSSAILYQPDRLPRAVEPAPVVETAAGLVEVLELVAESLGCPSTLVDVLASGPDYAAYSVFDFEGPTNHAAMAAVAAVSGITFDPLDEDARLCGPVLVVQTAHGLK